MQLKRYWNSLKNVTPFRQMKLEDSRDPNSYKGKKILARVAIDSPDEEVIIADVKGCAAIDGRKDSLDNPLIKYFEINGTHLCSMFSFYIQMMENRVPTPEEMDEFNLASDVKNIRAT